MMPSTPLVPNTPEYKKAQRQFLKATINRPVNFDQQWTPFRAAEKRFKARFPPLDLSSVLDLASRNDARIPEIISGVWAGSPDAVECIQISSDPKSAYIVPQIPGTQDASLRSELFNSNRC
jgi:alkylated DNA repair protein alkB homolog 1